MECRVKINICRILVENAKERRLFGRHRYEGEDNIQFGLVET
jgi:hypothetical protein